MTQMMLFVGTAPYVRNSETSKAAAQAVKPSAETLRQRLLACLRLHPDGMTDEEMQDALQMQGSTQRPRRIELVNMGMVEPSETAWRDPVTRKTRSGRLAQVWVAT